MTAAHLFDNPEHQATKAPPSQPAERVRNCCRAAREYTRLDRTVHQLAHSEVPFTEAWLAEECDCGLDSVRVACQRAVDAGSLYLASAQDRGRGRMYRGRL